MSQSALSSGNLERWVGEHGGRRPTIYLATIKNNTYLDRNDGKRLFLSQYIPPASNGLGAKFVFARNFEGKPFLGPEFTQVRFFSEVSSSVKIDQRFKVSDMQYNGKLEY